jgi:hypothetical protein
MTMAGATGPLGLTNSRSAAAAAAEASGDTLADAGGVDVGSADGVEVGTTAEPAAEELPAPVGVGDAGMGSALPFSLASPLALLPFPPGPAPGEPLAPTGALVSGDEGLEGAVAPAPALLLALVDAKTPTLPAGDAEESGDDVTLAVDTDEGEGVADELRGGDGATEKPCDSEGVASRLCEGDGEREELRDGDGVTERLREGGAAIVPPHPTTTG